MLRSSRPLCSSVAIIGGAGRIGKHLGLLLKMNPRVSELRLYGLKNTCVGVATDLSHCSTPCKVTGYGENALEEAVTDADLVIFLAGLPRSHPGMSRNDLFNANALRVEQLVPAIRRHAPEAIIAMMTEPVNCTMAVAAGCLEKYFGGFDPRKLVAVSTIDGERARAFLVQAKAIKKGVDVLDVHVPILGGHGSHTVVPVFSACKHQLRPIPQSTISQLTHRVRFGGDGVLKAKDLDGAAFLSPAMAAAKWVDGVVRALQGEKDIVLDTMVETTLSPINKSCRFFTSAVQFDTEGVCGALPLPPLNAYELELLDRCLPDLNSNIRKGKEWVLARTPPTW